MAGLFQEPTAESADLRFAQVALEQGLEKPDGLTYLVPEHLRSIEVGDRVIVPLGRRDRPVGGYVLSIAATPADLPAGLDRSRLKPIASHDRRSVNLPTDLVGLAHWIADYYCAPLGMVLATMLPAAVKRGTGLVRRRYVDLHDPVAIESIESIIQHHRLSSLQGRVLAEAARLAESGHLPVAPATLAEAAGARTESPVQTLVRKGLLKQATRTEVKAIWSEHAVSPTTSLELTDEQRRVLEAIDAGRGFFVKVLHGVTGSGKTEVYIRAIEKVVAGGGSAIVLVPEIALTPQTAGRFIGRFPHVAVLHSGLTAAQRHQQWMLIRDGWARVVVGARSAVFAPVSRLGLIVVDEEHDGSYKQDQVPRYHARDVAIKRGQMAGCGVVLGSATPSLESYHNALTRSEFELLTMSRRVSDLPLPRVQVVDMMQQRRERYSRGGDAARGVHLLSLPLEEELDRVFRAGGQAMLLLNRRGYANYISCPDHGCGWVMDCDHCSVHLVYHLDASLPTGGVLRCHHCGFENLMRPGCPLCGRKVTVFGMGTQRVEAEIGRRFPDIQWLRMDSDSMRTAEQYHQSLECFRRGEAQLLIGTQMIAKGLDFPNVRLVGVISADTALAMPDFRATERTFQLVCQVAGRSGRSSAGGKVIVQTYEPDHPVIALAANHDYPGFAQAEMTVRRQSKLPPVTRMARIVIRDQDRDRAEAAAAGLMAELEQANGRLASGAEIHGPAPAPIARVAGHWRFQIELVAGGAVVLQRLLTDLRNRGLLVSDARTAVDVDPVSLL